MKGFVCFGLLFLAVGVCSTSLTFTTTSNLPIGGAGEGNQFIIDSSSDKNIVLTPSAPGFAFQPQQPVIQIGSTYSEAVSIQALPTATPGPVEISVVIQIGTSQTTVTVSGISAFQTVISKLDFGGVPLNVTAGDPMETGLHFVSVDTPVVNGVVYAQLSSNAGNDVVFVPNPVTIQAGAYASEPFNLAATAAAVSGSYTIFATLTKGPSNNNVVSAATFSSPAAILLRQGRVFSAKISAPMDVTVGGAASATFFFSINTVAAAGPLIVTPSAPFMLFTPASGTIAVGSNSTSLFRVQALLSVANQRSALGAVKMSVAVTKGTANNNAIIRSPFVVPGLNVLPYLATTNCTRGVVPDGARSGEIMFSLSPSAIPDQYLFKNQLTQDISNSVKISASRVQIVGICVTPVNTKILAVVNILVVDPKATVAEPSSNDAWAALSSQAGDSSSLLHQGTVSSAIASTLTECEPGIFLSTCSSFSGAINGRGVSTGMSDAQKGVVAAAAILLGIGALVLICACICKKKAEPQETQALV